MLQYLAERQDGLSRAPGAGHIRSPSGTRSDSLDRPQPLGKCGLRGDERDPARQGYTRQVPTKKSRRRIYDCRVGRRLQLWAHWNQRGKADGAGKTATVWSAARSGLMRYGPAGEGMRFGSGRRGGRKTVRRSVPERRWLSNRVPAPVCFSSGCSVLSHCMETLRGSPMG